VIALWKIRSKHSNWAYYLALIGSALFCAHTGVLDALVWTTLFRRRDISSLIVTGLVTHGCVRATCLGGIELGYRVILVKDGHSSYSKDAAQLIEEWNQKLSDATVELAATSEIEFV
jgi:nicotinamidase-related amidase